MTTFQQTALLILLALTLVHNNEASAPFFLQAITSALGTIPFSAGPMTTGLVGAKLAVGSKLLYYLGLFGRRRSKPKPAPVTAASSKPNFGVGAQFPGGMQAMPLPYAFGAGGMPSQFGGFEQPSFFNQYPYGYDPAQLFQMLAAQGIDPISAMQAMNFNGGAGAQAIPSSQFPFPSGAGAGAGPGPIPFGGGHGIPNFEQKQSTSVDIPSGGGAGESEGDVESFFTFLRDMDDNTCISRLMCDIGANPSFLGDFSENIYGIISQLDVEPTSGAFQYISIMENGRRDGGCGQRFPQCSDAAYEVVKNVAPSVGMPQNINSDTVNQL